MRRAAVALLMLAAFAVPAAAQQSKPRRGMLVIPPANSTPVATGGASVPLPILAGALPSNSQTDAEAAPQCRAQCAEQRYFCMGGSDGQCDQRWSQCLQACRPTPPS